MQRQSIGSTANVEFSILQKLVCSNKFLTSRLESHRRERSRASDKTSRCRSAAPPRLLRSLTFSTALLRLGHCFDVETEASAGTLFFSQRGLRPEYPEPPTSSESPPRCVMLESSHREDHLKTVASFQGRRCRDRNPWCGVCEVLVKAHLASQKFGK